MRAWTIHKGDTAPQPAGVIHSDFERGFIRAQTIAFDDFIAGKARPAPKEAGKMRALMPNIWIPHNPTEAEGAATSALLELIFYSSPFLAKC